MALTFVPGCSGHTVPNQNRHTEARMKQKDSLSLCSCPHCCQAPVLCLGLTLRNARQDGDLAETQQIL